MILRHMQPQGASYMTPNGAGRAQDGAGHKRTIVATVMVMLSVLMLTFAGLSTAVNVREKQQVQAGDWTQWLMCEVLPESAKELYQFSQSKDLQFHLRSKSAITGGIDDVDGGLNWMLSGSSGTDFKKVNEEILGFSLDPESDGQPQPNQQSGSQQDQKQAGDQKSGDGKTPTGGKYVNPYDRFGVAGMKFSAYQGEWKYFVIDSCKKDGEPNDPKAGLFYDSRLEPRSGWEDIGNSKDVRTQQFQANPSAPILATALNSVANGLFNITKLIVSVTIAFVGFSFSDIVHTMGLDNVIGGQSGMFKNLFNGVFMPLVVFAFLTTGAYLIYNGVFKGRYRESFNSVARSFLIFAIAIVVGMHPAQAMTLPNKAIVWFQSVIVLSLNSQIAGGDDMCATDIGQVNSKIIESQGKSEQGVLDEAAQNIRSVVSCRMWQVLLLKPWAEGQFGTDINNLWANGNKPGWAPENAQELGNSNNDMVGSAEVPLGEGKSIHNWGVYQISTQTNAHWVTSGNGTRVKPINGVAGDWYRIVDALANYDEEDAKEKPSDNAEEITYKVPKESNKVSPYWDTWVGNSVASRYTSALSSILVAALVCASMALFAGWASVYTIGLAILLGFAPLFMLLACWAGRGWEIFKGWAELTVKTGLSRIVVGILLVFNILIVNNILNMANTLSWGKMITLLMILTVIMFKGREKITEMFAAVQFGGVNMASTASRVTDRTKNIVMAPVKTSGRFATSAVGGGVGARREGGSFMRGMGAGAVQEFKNMTYRSGMLRDARTTYDTHAAAAGKKGVLVSEMNCAVCGKPLDYEQNQYGTQQFIGGRDRNGNLVCRECLEDGMGDDVQEVTFNRPTAAQRRDASKSKDAQRKKIRESYNKRFTDDTAGRTVAENTASGIHDMRNEDLNTIAGRENRAENEAKLRAAMSMVHQDVHAHKSAKDYSRDKKKDPRTITTTKLPKEIDGIVDKGALQEAWMKQDYNYVIMTYVSAWIVWYQQNTGVKYSADINSTYYAVKNKNLEAFDKAEYHRIMDEGKPRRANAKAKNQAPSGGGSEDKE